MASNREALQNANLTVSEVARIAGVRRTAVADYLARRWTKCGTSNRKKIHAVLVSLAIVPKPDPNALARRRMREFHRDANSLALYRQLTHQPVLTCLPGDQFYMRRFAEVI